MVERFATERRGGSPSFLSGSVLRFKPLNSSKFIEVSQPTREDAIPTYFFLRILFFTRIKPDNKPDSGNEPKAEQLAKFGRGMHVGVFNMK